MIKVASSIAFDEEKILGKTIDFVQIEWFEANKRILRRESKLGKDVMIKRKDFSPFLQHDILHIDEEHALLIDILETDAIQVELTDIFLAASVCYDIGNRHAPLFFENNSVFVAYDRPMYAMLEKAAYAPKKVRRVLQNMLRTNIPRHQHSGETLLTKVLKSIQK